MNTTDPRTGQRGYREIIEGDLEILPMMNIFIVLIPMLLLSAVFVEISSIDLKLPSSEEPVDEMAQVDGLELAIRIDDHTFVIEGNGIEARIVQRDVSGTDDAIEAGRARLGRELIAIVGDRPGERDVRIVSRPDTRYEEIIAVMDVARESGLDRVGLSGGASRAAGTGTRLAAWVFRQRGDVR